ncbi:MAG TPA: hypothetical protein VIV12_03320 [Streptosporangiaceae bacterium]
MWWRRLHDGSEEHLDNTHLMRMAGRFSRRVRAWAKANQIPVIDCGRGERKHQIAEDYLAAHQVSHGVFLYDLTLFKVHFGNLTLKAYTKGEHVLRFEAIVHNTRDLGCGRVLARFGEITTRLKAMLERFCTTLDCVDAAFIADQTLKQLPLGSQIGSTRVGGVDLNSPASAPHWRPCSRWPPHPAGSPSPSWPPRSSSRPGRPTRSPPPRQAAYDLKKLRGKHLVVKPGRSRRYHASPEALRTITALLVLRDQVVKPILAGVRVPRRGRKPATWTRTDQHYEALRLEMKALFDDLGIAA